MKRVINLIKNCKPLQVVGNPDVDILSIAFDSRKVVDGAMYVAQRGVNADGHQFIASAISKGAVAVVCECLPDVLNVEVVYILVEDSSNALGVISSCFYDEPSSKLKLVGITGTNGKTTTVTLLHKLFTNLGYKCGMLSTVHNKIAEEIIPSSHTTPDAVQLNELLHDMVMEGCEFVFMEVSSHAIVQQRIAGLVFAGAIFSNLTHDHLDYHKTFDGYLKAKKQFFDELPATAFALTNADDRNGSVMLQNTKAKKNDYSIRSMADFRSKIIENTLEGLCLQFDLIPVWFKLVGEFNAHNIMAVYGTACLLGIPSNDVLQTLSGLSSAEGRFEYVRNTHGIVAVVDYAHTPDALENVLKTIKDVCTGNEKIITVIGCGGDRDALKRPKMAQIAADNSNQVVLTSDNPRTEDPKKILEQMQAGLTLLQMKNVLTIESRKDAIKTACILAQSGDVILVAGKGHEKYQEINGVKNHFDDKEELIYFLNI
ncbi:MAG: UDP-N-acetylmuramoyl-L-alanyl-D-glutamate--2,6-diaminopimelate ligase [Bacteroidota bacterium]